MVRMRRYFKDRYNANKVWEIVQLSGGNYYVRQYIKGKQFGVGRRMHKKLIDDIGMMEGEEL